MTNYLDDGNIQPEHDHHIVMIFSRKKDDNKQRKSTICFFQEIIRKDFIAEKKQLYKAMAEHYNARIYVSINPINFKLAREDLIIRLVQSMASDTHNNITGQLISSCMRFPRKDKKKFMLDIDTKDNKIILKIGATLLDYAKDHKEFIIYDKLETKNGYHYIVSPFDIRILSEFPDVEVKKNGMTTLDYIKDEN